MPLLRPICVAHSKNIGKSRTHAGRLEEIFAHSGDTIKTQKCRGMEGLIKESAEVIKQDIDDDVKGAALIAAAQRVEHYAA